MKHVLMAVCCVVVCGVVVAQTGAPAGAPAKQEAAPVAKPEPLAPEVEAWLRTLAKKIADAQPLVRDTAAAGLEKAGKPALPILDEVVKGSDKALADAAKKLVERINRGPQPGDQRRGPMNAGNRVDELAKELKLDEQKTQKIKDLQKATMDFMREHFEAVQSGDLTREEAREEMNQHMKDLKQEYRKFLTEDEAKKFDEVLDRGMMGGRGRGGRGGGEDAGPRRNRGGRGEGGGQGGGGGRGE